MTTNSYSIKTTVGVIEALELLKQNNKVCILLSNSSKRKSSSYKGLKKVGIDPSYFQDIVTSGELGYHIIKNKVLYKNNKMMNYFVIGNNDDDAEYIKSADCTITDISQADVVLVRGTFSILKSSSHKSVSNDPSNTHISSYNTSTSTSTTTVIDNIEKISYTNAHDLVNNIDIWLQECRRFDLPMLITNPDFYRPGNNEPMP